MAKPKLVKPIAPVDLNRAKKGVSILDFKPIRRKKRVTERQIKRAIVDGALGSTK